MYRRTLRHKVSVLDFNGKVPLWVKVSYVRLHRKVMGVTVGLRALFSGDPWDFLGWLGFSNRTVIKHEPKLDRPITIKCPAEEWDSRTGEPMTTTTAYIVRDGFTHATHPVFNKGGRWPKPKGPEATDADVEEYNLGRTRDEGCVGWTPCKLRGTPEQISALHRAVEKCTDVNEKILLKTELAVAETLVDPEVEKLSEIWHKP